MTHHENFIQQLAEIEQRKIDDDQAAVDRMHLEAQALNLRHNINALLDAAGFELDIDHWGTGRIVLQHTSSTGDFDVDFGTGQVV